MTDGAAVAAALLVVGLVAVATTPMRALFARLGVPDLIGYILIGLALGAVDAELPFLTPETMNGLDILAAAGIVVLLFRAGLESHPHKLMRQLPKASLGLIGNVVGSAGLGYVGARYLIGAEPVAAIFVAVALSATSVGVSVAVWRAAGAIDTPRGALLLDLAELDDVAAVFLLALLLALVPILYGSGEGSPAREVLTAVAWLAVKFVGFGTACLLFATYAEERLTRWYGRLDAAHAPIVSVAGMAFVIAAIADQLGFSLAIGALFAGLAFSGDPKRVRLDHAFDSLFGLFVPFFFIGIGLDVAIDSLVGALAVGGILLAVAIVGKVVGTALSLVAVTGGAGALLVAVSMVPRAEIAMVVMERGRALGDWAVPPEIYAAMVVVTLGTCLVTPPLVQMLLRRNKEGLRHGD